MQARFIGPPDLLERIADVLREHGVEVSAPYSSRRGGSDVRLYANLDDRRVEALLAPRKR